MPAIGTLAAARFIRKWARRYTVGVDFMLWKALLLVVVVFLWNFWRGLTGRPTKARHDTQVEARQKQETTRQ